MLNYTAVAFLLVIFFINQVHCCYYATEDSRAVCSSLLEVSVDGNDTWSKLLVTNNKGIFLTVKENSFKRTPNLRVLSLTDIIDIHKGAFTGLEKLDMISIYASKIVESLHKDVFDNLPISRLQINSAEMTQLPVGLFEDLPEVRIVDFRTNNLTKLPAGVFNNTPIYILYLDKNQIETIEDGTFINMENLIHLSLTKNKLTSFESKRVLGTSNSLTQLWLNKNELTKITTKVIDSVPLLEKVYFEVNMIDSIEDGSFDKVPYIDFIDLSNNHLSDFPPKIFPATGLKELYYFFLHNNRLTFINRAVFLRAPKIHFLTFGGNPLQCSCLDELKSITVNKNILRPCDNVYYTGDRPTCINAEHLSPECLYDDDLTKDLYEQYNAAIAEYPKLEQKCDTTRGIENITLA